MGTAALAAGAPARVEALAVLRPLAQVTRDLGIRTEAQVARRPGVVASARGLAEAFGVTVNITFDGDCIRARFAPTR